MRAGLLDERPWVLAVVPATLLSLLLHLALAYEFEQGRVIWDAWRHRPGLPWAWVPFIHPPAYTEFLRTVERGAAAAGLTPERFSILLAAPCSAALVPLCAAAVRAARPDAAGRWVALAALLAACSPGLLRPFEDYPLAVLLVTAALVLALTYGRRGGAPAWLGTAVLTLAAVELHLGAWFLLGPLLFGLLLFVPGRRLGALLLILLTVGLFLLTTLVPGAGLWGLFDHPHAYFGEDRRFGTFWWRDPNVEWTNPLLFAGLLPLLVPGLTRAARPLRALAPALLAYTAATLVLMAAGLAISGSRARAHHYFELVDPALAAAAALGLASLAASPSRRRLATGLGLALLASQLAFLVDARLALGRIARAPWLWEQPIHELRLDGSGVSPRAWIHVGLGGSDPAWILRRVGRVELVIAPEAPLRHFSGRRLTAEGLPFPWTLSDRLGEDGVPDLVLDFNLDEAIALPSTGIEPGLNLPLRFTARAFAYDDPSGGRLVGVSSLKGPFELDAGGLVFVRLDDLAPVEAGAPP